MTICKNALVAVVTVAGIAGVATVACMSLATGHNHVLEAYSAITGLATIGATAISHFMKDGAASSPPK